MIVVSEYRDKTVGVFGLGKAGQASMEALTAGGAKVFAWDDKQQAETETVLSFEKWPWDELQALVLAPGVPLTHPKPHAVVEMAKKHKVPVIGDIELLYRACPNARIIAITGTNGKSTTTALTAHILKAAGKKVEVGGNLGTAALSLEPLGADGIYVLELSSYQLDLVQTTRFDVTMLLNITPDHLDRHGSMEGYIAAKKHIFERQAADDVAIIAVDDEHTQAIAEALEKQQLVRVSGYHEMPDGVYVQDGVLHDGSKYFDLKQIASLPGKHNGQNAAAAYAAVKACGIAPEKIYEGMKTFPGLAHRLQFVTSLQGVKFINDSKATNAEAAAHALAAFERIYWIAGGKAKEGGIAALEEYFPKIAHAFLVGEDEKLFANTLQGKASYTCCNTLDVAVKKAADMAFASDKKGVVLLSPAAASFDQWDNFEARGEAFCDLVSQLAAGGVRDAS